MYLISLLLIEPMRWVLLEGTTLNKNKKDRYPLFRRRNYNRNPSKKRSIPEFIWDGKSTRVAGPGQKWGGFWSGSWESPLWPVVAYPPRRILPEKRIGSNFPLTASAPSAPVSCKRDGSGLTHPVPTPDHSKSPCFYFWGKFVLFNFSIFVAKKLFIIFWFFL